MKRQSEYEYLIDKRDKLYEEEPDSIEIEIITEKIWDILNEQVNHN